MIKPSNSSAIIQTSTKNSCTRKLSVEIVGKGEPIILLHGWGWHSGVWQNLVTELAQDYQLFLIDLPGFGHSQFDLDDYTFESIAELIFPHVPEPAAWVGWSLGGMLATWIALQYPEKVTRLITVASSPRFVQNHHWPGVPPATLTTFSTLLLADYEKTLVDFLELQLRGNPRNEDLFAQLKTQLFAREKPRLSALLGGLALLRNIDLRENLSALQCRSLFMFGANDTLVPVKVVEKISALSAQIDCKIIPRVGHMPFLLQEEFVTHVRKHLHK